MRFVGSFSTMRCTRLKALGEMECHSSEEKSMVPFLYSKRERQLQSEKQDFASVVALVGRIAGEQDVQENAERIHIAGC